MHNLDMAQVSYKLPILYRMKPHAVTAWLHACSQLSVLHKGLHSDKELGVSFLTTLPVLALRPTCLTVLTTDSTSTTVVTLRMPELFAQEVYIFHLILRR